MSFLEMLLAAVFSTWYNYVSSDSERMVTSETATISTGQRYST